MSKMWIGEKMEVCITIIFLGICSYFDLKEQKVKLAFLGASGSIAIFFQGFYQIETLWSIMAGISIGVVLLFISFISRENIGYGDGCAFLVTGILLGFQRNFEMLIISLLCSSIWALYLLIIKKKKGSESYPFFPFVFLACSIIWASEKFA